MSPEDVLSVLRAKDINYLYHANTVTTSATFLNHAALLSRGYAATNRLGQTVQYTDNIDRQYGIWHDVFLDTDDYHRRIRRPNHYGPVTFVLESDILRDLPKGSEVLVTKLNPTKWAEFSVAERYFSSCGELFNSLSRGTFDQMVTIRSPAQLVPFGCSLVEIRLDDPHAIAPGGSNIYASAKASLVTAAGSGGVASPIVRQTCRDECKCVPMYGADPRLGIKF